MAESLVELDVIRFRRVFPWLHLFRGFWIAADVRKLLLAATGLLLISAGNGLLDLLPLEQSGHRQTARPLPETRFDFKAVPGAGRPLDPTSLRAVAPAGLPQVLGQFSRQWPLVLRPMRTVLDPAVTLLSPGLTWPVAIDAVARLLIALLVWSLVGGAIVRMAAVEFARDERLPLMSGLRFAAAKYLSFLGAPLLPAVALSLLALLVVAGGLVGRIPVAGPVIAGALWVLPLLFSLMMVIVLIGVIPGWPLMMAAIGTEGSDAFDGFSRSCSYVYGRFWNYLWYIFVNCLLGAAGYLLIAVVFGLTAWLAARLMAAGMGTEVVATLHADSFAGVFLTGGQAEPGDTTRLGAMFVHWWLSALVLLQAAFLYSWFWCAATMSYFLPRLVDDATAIAEVWLPEDDDDDELLPLAGVAASEQPVVERPPIAGHEPGSGIPPEGDSEPPVGGGAVSGDSTGSEASTDASDGDRTGESGAATSD